MNDEPMDTQQQSQPELEPYCIASHRKVGAFSVSRSVVEGCMEAKECGGTLRSRA